MIQSRRDKILARIEKRKGPGRKMTLGEFVQYMDGNREKLNSEFLAERGFSSFEEMAESIRSLNKGFANARSQARQNPESHRAAEGASESPVSIDG